MRTPDAFLKQIPTDTPWSKASIRLMRRMGRMGKTQALKLELKEPFLADREWIDTVKALLSGDPMPKLGDDDPKNDFSYTFACSGCRGLGYTTEEGEGDILYSKICESCQKGENLRAGVRYSAAKDRLEQSKLEKKREIRHTKVLEAADRFDGKESRDEEDLPF